MIKTGDVVTLRDRGSWEIKIGAKYGDSFLVLDANPSNEFDYPGLIIRHLKTGKVNPSPRRKNRYKEING